MLVDMILGGVIGAVIAGIATLPVLQDARRQLGSANTEIDAQVAVVVQLRERLRRSVDREGALLTVQGLLRSQLGEAQKAGGRDAQTVEGVE